MDSFRRKRPASESTESLKRETSRMNHQNESQSELHSNRQISGHEDHFPSLEEETFLDEFTDIQYEDVDSLALSLDFLNLDHTNFEP